MWFGKTNITLNKIKNGMVDQIFYVNMETKFLAMNHIPKFIAIIFPEEIRKHTWRQET